MMGAVVPLLEFASAFYFALRAKQKRGEGEGKSAYLKKKKRLFKKEKKSAPFLSGFMIGWPAGGALGRIGAGNE